MSRDASPPLRSPLELLLPEARDTKAVATPAAPSVIASTRGAFRGARGCETIARRCNGRTRQEVADKLHALLQTRREGLPIATRDTSLERFLAEWLDTVRPTVRLGTWQRYEVWLSVWLSKCIAGPASHAKLLVSARSSGDRATDF
jgi:hypothetical protein